MNVIGTVSREKESTYMKTFTIDTDNNITVHASRKAAKETSLGVFATEEQFADLIGPDNKRLVEIWNSLPGVKPVTKFANRKMATERIWGAIQMLADTASAAKETANAEPQETFAEQPVAAAEQSVVPPEEPIAETNPKRGSADARRTAGRRWRTGGRGCVRTAGCNRWDHFREEGAQSQEGDDGSR